MQIWFNFMYICIPCVAATFILHMVAAHDKSYLLCTVEQLTCTLPPKSIFIRAISYTLNTLQHQITITDFLK